MRNGVVSAEVLGFFRNLSSFYYTAISPAKTSKLTTHSLLPVTISKKPFSRHLHDRVKLSVRREVKMETPSLANPVRAKMERPRTLPVLPPDLIAEVLTWLPVVSLLRFRLVSKWFKTLISSPDFVKAHLRSMKASSAFKPNRVDRLFRRSLDFLQPIIKPEPRLKGHSKYPANPRHRIRQIYRTLPDIDWGSHSWSLDSLYNGPRMEAVELVDLFEGVDYGGDWVAGSCDGLLCSVLGLYHGVVVWNPSTRVMRELPDFDYDISEEQMRRCYNVFGFGYDCQLDDYKVVVMISYPAENRNGPDEFETQVQVFALQTESWRRIEDFKYGAPADEGVKFVDGCPYYEVPSFVEGNGRKDTLVSLDLATEKYDKVTLPDFDDPAVHWELESLVDRLCVACFDDDYSCEVWVMKEPRVTGAWTKLYKVDQVMVNLGLHAPLYIPDNGEALWENDEDLFIYNPKDTTIRFPTSRGLADRDGPAVIYMETLVSPKMDNSALFVVILILHSSISSIAPKLLEVRFMIKPTVCPGESSDCFLVRTMLVECVVACWNHQQQVSMVGTSTTPQGQTGRE